MPLDSTARALPHAHTAIPWERRRRRTIGVADALRYALRSSARRGHLKLVFVADDYGMIVSGSRRDLDLEPIAAVAPLVARGRAKARVHHRGASLEMTVRTVRLDGERLHVAAVGGDPVARRRELATAVCAAQRIMG
ncbi:MAG: hypothetical protein V3V08_02940 [Nannocystaceae bacterium]